MTNRTSELVAQDVTPRLYIIMREDLWDMNPGKGMAQAAHAQADFTAYINRLIWNEKIESEIVAAWQETRNFGTTLVLSAPLEDLVDMTENLPHAGLVVDPTYPWRNHYGKLFTTAETTCAWVFATTDLEIQYMQKWKLHQ